MDPRPSNRLEETLDGVTAIDRSAIRQRCVGAVDTPLLRARVRRQVIPERIEVQPHADHILVYHHSGDGLVERFYDDRLSGSLHGVGTVSVMPAGRASQWWIPEEIEVLHVCVAASRLRRLAECDFGMDPARVEVIDGLGRDDAAGRALGDAVIAATREHSGACPLFVDALEQAFAVHLLRAYTTRPPPPPQPTGSDKRIARAIDYLETNISSRIGLAELAEAACLSPYHFSRCFRAATGESAHAYLMRRRVERARQLIASGERSLAHVAYACGFASQAHLTTAFKRRTGLTPGEFRQSFN